MEWGEGVGAQLCGTPQGSVARGLLLVLTRPEGVPVHPSGEVWMDTGTLSSSVIWGALLCCRAIQSGTGRWEEWGH